MIQLIDTIGDSIFILGDSEVSYTSIARLFVVGAVGAVGIYSYLDRKLNNIVIEGTIRSIDRSCHYDTYYENKEGKRTNLGNETRSCSSTSEFQQIASDYKHRGKDVEGKATVRVLYTLPESGGTYLSDLVLTGKDDAFYTLREHDKIRILVSKTDPTKIRRD